MHLHWIHHVVGWMRTIQDAGPSGWLLFIGLFALCCLFFVPGSVLTIAAGAVYGFWGGVALVLIGNGVGSVCCLLVTRFFLRDWMRKLVERNPKIKALEQAVAQDDLWLVFLTRLSPVMPFSLINYTLGLTKISAWRFLLAIELGALPATCIYVYFGCLIGNLAQIGPEMKEHRPEVFLLQMLGLALAIGVTIYVTFVARRKLHESMEGKGKRGKTRRAGAPATA
jgi:uncharacterized membrane protein YdjX (TVP38/TMEM64 family)